VLSSLDDLQNLSDRLKERILIFMELNCGIVPAWIENVTNKNLDEWFLIMKTKGGQLEQRGLWASFMNFVGGKIAALERFSKGDGAEKRYGLKDISGTEIVPAEYEDLLEETDGNCFIVMKGGRWGMIQADLHGKEAIPLKYDRILPFCLEKGLFQCKQGPDYFIINHEGNAIELFGDLIGSNGVLQSKYPFFTYPSKQNSFDVVTDNRTLLYDAVLSDEGKVLGFTVKNTFKKVFCIPGSDGKNYVYAKGANDGVEIYTKKGGGYEAVAGLSDYSDFESWAGCALLLVRNTQGKWGLAAPEKGNSVVECTWDYAQLQSPYVLFIGSNKTAGELYDISEKAKLLYRFSFDSLGFKIADPDGKELFDAAYGLGIGPFGLSETFFSPQGFSSRTFIRQGGLWCGASGSVGDFASRTPVLFDIRSGEANLRCGLDTKLGEAVFFTKLDITVQVNILQQWFDKEKLLEANTALDLLMKESSLDDLRFQEYCGKLVLFNPAAKGNTAPGLSKSLDSYCAEAGNRFLKKGDDTASLAHFMNAAQYNAKSDYYQYMLAFICKKKGDTKTALGYIENAINLNPKDAASWSLKGTLLYTEKQHNESITAFSWAIDIQSDPKKKATYYGNRALAYSAVGMKDKAEADLAAAKLG
jgi:tetratricopeptide (TPR) repeat protein